MKITKVYQPADLRLRKIITKKREWKLPASFCNVREDYFTKSKKFPIFTVADGVTLIVEPGKEYPNPSGAGRAAKIFCQCAVKNLEKIYCDFEKKNLQEIFEKANREVEKYNAKVRKHNDQIVRQAYENEKNQNCRPL